MAGEAERRGQASLALLYGFGIVAVVGYATFGRHPGLLAAVPSAAAIYPYTFQLFSVGHIVLAAAVLVHRLSLAAGARWLPALAVLYALSLGSELAGTTTGLPFGEYSYNPILGWMWFGHVPAVIPLSWFCMALPSYAVALAAYPARDAWVKRVLAGSLVLLAWDLALDPAMSYATRYWVWASSGAYYGMPWLNLFGWYVTGVALMGALAGLRAERWLRVVGPRWWVAYYGANLILPLGMNVAAGLWVSVLATLGMLALLVAWLRPAPEIVPMRVTADVEFVSSHAGD